MKIRTRYSKTLDTAIATGCYAKMPVLAHADALVSYTVGLAATGVRRPLCRIVEPSVGIDSLLKDHYNIIKLRQAYERADRIEVYMSVGVTEANIVVIITFHAAGPGKNKPALLELEGGVDSDGMRLLREASAKK